jgi:hypothetical protein
LLYFITAKVFTGNEFCNIAAVNIIENQGRKIPKTGHK